MFLSTPPSRVATVQYIIVSLSDCSFYPRHPRGWRLSCRNEQRRHRSVSIHATLAGGDLKDRVRAMAWSTFLSTPPSRVATQHTISASRQLHRFYPRHPRGWRLLQAKSILPFNKRFYPRHPRGWRRDFDFHSCALLLFLSTPPSRVATARESAQGW